MWRKNIISFLLFIIIKLVCTVPSIDKGISNVAVSTRPLISGDVFTPTELLPVAVKLIAKVKNPGLGKGIVSSTRKPKVLSDRLFTDMFITDKRIVTLTDYDIISLDALQALALDGEVPSNKYYSSPRLDRQGNDLPTYVKDMPIIEENSTKKTRITSRYLLIVKNTHGKPSNNDERQKIDKQYEQCRWKYVCSNPVYLNTCWLRTTCFKNKKHVYNETMRYLKSLRKMIGISTVDENVGKLIHARAMHNNKVQLEPEYLRRENNKMASLDDLFDRISESLKHGSTLQFSTTTRHDMSIFNRQTIKNI